MGSQLLELKWANHKSNMALELQELYLSDALLDVTIACGEFTLKAHKTVLSASSTFFRKLFIDNPCKHPILIMTDIEFEDLKTIVQFMYQGEIHISRGKLTQFLKIADRLKVKGLTSMDHMDISPSEQPDIDVDLQYSSGVWKHTNTQSKQQDIPEPEGTCSKKVTDCSLSDIDQGTGAVKLEHDSPRPDNDDCMYWQSDCFDQTSAPAVLPDCSLSSSPSASQQLAAPSVSHQPSTHPVSHQLPVQPVSQSPSSSHQLCDSESLQQTDDPSVSHQLAASLNSESERFSYPESHSDNKTLMQEPEDVTGGDVIPVNLYQSQDQSPISIPSSSKSFEIVESLSGQSSSQGGKPGIEPLIGLKKSPYTLRTRDTNRQRNMHQEFDFWKHDSLTWDCEYCNKSFRRYNTLEKHLKFHSQKKNFTCMLCNLTFQRKHGLRQHLRIHTGKKPFTCSICNKQFRRLDNFKSHQRVHTGEKPFSCKICNKRFAYGCNLRVHERIHSGEKPYLCSICNKQFSHSRNFKIHQRMHTGEKPFLCGVCNKQFADMSSFRKHERTHT